MATDCIYTGLAEMGREIGNGNRMAGAEAGKVSTQGEAPV